MQQTKDNAPFHLSSTRHESPMLRLKRSQRNYSPLCHRKDNVCLNIHHCNITRQRPPGAPQCSPPCSLLHAAHLKHHRMRRNCPDLPVNKHAPLPLSSLPLFPNLHRHSQPYNYLRSICSIRTKHATRITHTTSRTPKHATSFTPFQSSVSNSFKRLFLSLTLISSEPEPVSPLRFKPLQTSSGTSTMRGMRERKKAPEGTDHALCTYLLNAAPLSMSN